MISPVSLALGIALGTALSAATAYLLALLFGYLSGAGAVQRHHVESAGRLPARLGRLRIRPGRPRSRADSGDAQPLSASAAGATRPD